MFSSHLSLGEGKDTDISTVLVLRSLPLIAAIFSGDFYNFYYDHLKVNFLNPHRSLAITSVHSVCPFIAEGTELTI